MENLALNQIVNEYKSTASYLPLGLRINNAGCIRDSKSRWLGKVGVVNGFVKFDTFESGLRACVMLLCKYVLKDHLKRIVDIVSKYAPLSDGNLTNQYSYYIKQITGLERIYDSVDMLKCQLPLVVDAIFKMENGRYYIELSNNNDFKRLFSSLCEDYINEYLNNVYYPVHGKVEKI